MAGIPGLSLNHFDAYMEKTDLRISRYDRNTSIAINFKVQGNLDCEHTDNLTTLLIRPLFGCPI